MSDDIVSPPHKADDLCSLPYWFDAIKDIDIEQPKTSILDTKHIDYPHWWSWLDKGENKEIERAINDFKDLCTKMGYPAFIRTDQTSNKHAWENTCFVKDEFSVSKNVSNLVEFSLCATMLGLPINALVVREFIPMYNLGHAFHGKMPISPEIRLFVKDGKYLCHHWYWPEDAMLRASPELMAGLKKGRQMAEIELNQGFYTWLSQEIGDCLEGAWSVDLCRSAEGDWYLIDMAVASLSWHPESCSNHKLLRQ